MLPMLATCPDQRRNDPSDLPGLRGDFEVHLTVGPGAAEALAAWAADHGLKFTHILLARGTAPSQPMLTLRARGTLEETAAATARTAERLARSGFAVLRTKIEATPWAEGVPATDADAAAHGPHRYFEHHLKLLLPPATPVGAAAGNSPALAALAPLAALAVRHDAHLSHNPRRTREDGHREWFVTQRCRHVGLATAGRRLDALLADLATAGHRVLSAEREFVAVDSDEALDAGWITEHDHPAGPREAATGPAEAAEPEAAAREGDSR
ncbi:hypothetical protein SAMN05216371_6300 [Streptomyces sp. TLI_053]|uniref:hypothetical protein n=1 Tax=Streptomyces sp. TLI_053 TaxID=1855352 RepID=UPI00087C848B|nr:hypothetical protein SAMN05216371_6300 [Streptomyces sp. TLI_053]